MQQPIYAGASPGKPGVSIPAAMLALGTGIPGLVLAQSSPFLTGATALPAAADLWRVGLPPRRGLGLLQSPWREGGGQRE